ncbi:metal-sensing transcriptional repressor [Clostridium fungisolvens]|uniref:Copper-sensing transcriptional repressor CsoR n=1 Tax=Clostridium fungisolvens TaxID=1604897 RepID=A0A6V8SG21_9CLOT|nr:metal-sensing transcriptional repressor [Clostridium fungisolvens]GFP75731.1 Copper-sensing transcriptional repressor CsoR [Clostridium fungisolvens]
MNEEQKKALELLEVTKGQIDGIIKIIEEEKYCASVSNQIIAAQDLLKKANLLILRQHIQYCVTDAVLNDRAEKKLDEIMDILEKFIEK